MQLPTPPHTWNGAGGDTTAAHRGFDFVESHDHADGRPSCSLSIRASSWSERSRPAASPRTLARPDSSRYLDVTVLLGSTWRPPAQPLDP